MDKTAQGTPTKEWIDYRVCVKHFHKHLFPVTLLAEKQAGSSQKGGGDSACTSTHVNNQKNTREFISV